MYVKFLLAINVFDQTNTRGLAEGQIVMIIQVDVLRPDEHLQLVTGLKHSLSGINGFLILPILCYERKIKQRRVFFIV